MEAKASVLADELMRMAEADQAMRNSNMEGGPWDASVDEANTKRLEEIIDVEGWPTISRFGHNAHRPHGLLPNTPSARHFKLDV